jgi:asparagine synthase (glutamine-hydrolysing)
MKHFVLAHRPWGTLADEDMLKIVDASVTSRPHTLCRGLTWHAILFGDGDGAAALTEPVAGAGVAALDNRDELSADHCGSRATGSDVALSLWHLARSCQPAAARGMLGAFGVVLVTDDGRDVLIARDALGVAPVYYRFVGDTLVVSSSAMALACNCDIDREYVAEYLVGGGNPEGRTIWDAVRALMPGSIATRQGNTLRVQTYWSALDFDAQVNVDADAAAEEFRALFAKAVRASVGTAPGTWAELSGGVDSSSVVSMATVLARQGVIPNAIGGTISIVDDLGWGDERRYSDAVVRHYGLHSIQLPAAWPFADDGIAPPPADAPYAGYLQYAADRRYKRTLATVGCARLLSGHGADHYLTAQLVYVADYLASGRVGPALTALISWATTTRRSVWEGLLGFGIFPLLSAQRRRRAAAKRQVPRWLRTKFIADYDLPSRTLAVRRYAGAWGHKAASAMATDIAMLVPDLHPSRVFDSPSVRYPFLYRPLIELALRLPAPVVAMPRRNKLIVRRALGDDLPIEVRTRMSKGRVGTRCVWALNHEATNVDALLDNSVLHELGFVSVKKLRKQIERARLGRNVSLPLLLATLSLELWLRHNWKQQVSVVGEREVSAMASV